MEQPEFGMANHLKYSIFLKPYMLGQVVIDVGTSIAQEMDSPSLSACPNLHSVLSLHTPPETLILVPRCHCAFLVSLAGVVLRTFSVDTTCVMVAACVSPSNKWF
jgi:hypothetical protein